MEKLATHHVRLHARHEGGNIARIARMRVRVEILHQYAGGRGHVQARVRVEITVPKKGPCAKLGYLQQGNQHSVRFG